MRSIGILLAAFLFSPVAFAQDAEEDPFNFDDLLDDDEDADTEPDSDRIDDADDLDFDDSDDDFQFLDDEAEPGEDLLQGEEENQFDDTAVLYRRQLDALRGAAPEDEVEAWERYLERYPNSAYQDRIQDRIDAILSELYGNDLDPDTSDGVDALDAEIDFSQGLLLENINPRTNVQAGIEWGLPDFGNLYGGYEHQLRRDFSVHGSIRRRYTGWGFEAGARYALIKSLRTNTLVTAMGTVHLNSNPTFIGFRPMIAVGKRIGRIDLQGQFGGELEITGPVGFRLFGGANVTWRASDSVALFGETSIQAKNLTFAEGKPFNFTVLTFGMKFMPVPNGMDPGQLQINVGANVPYSTNYWMYHFGSIMAQINYYPK